MNEENCIRLYNEDGKHVLSILHCDNIGTYDLATPDGSVVWCEANGLLSCLVRDSEEIDLPHRPIEDRKPQI